MRNRYWMTLTLALTFDCGQAADLASLIPLQDPHCAVRNPPSAAGLAVTPGGFVMVFPRNGALTGRYTGCKIMWVVDGERSLRFATLHFKSGELHVAVAHNVRDPTAGIRGACLFPQGKSLLPDAGDKLKDAACKGFTEDAFYGLRLPTWPRRCLTDPQARVCQEDPS
ncbi:MAG: hypothetical protein FJY37_04235 [Betaproteobacteria bacterium]|nr:hypothetical protein [Betaproteobacteria bacterium]